MEYFTTLITFLLGLFSGFILFALVYIYFVVRGRGIDKAWRQRHAADVDEEELKAIVTEKQNAYKRGRKKGQSPTRMVLDLSIEMVEEIARTYFPNSKYPTLELSVDEMLALNHYIAKRIEKILDQPVLRNTRNLRVTKIVRMYETQRAISQAKVVKAARSKAVKTTLKATMGAINFMNPAYWFRRLVINKSVDFVTTHIALMALAIVGEETIKVYSKKLFDKDVELDLVDKELRALEAEHEDD